MLATLLQMHTKAKVVKPAKHPVKSKAIEKDAFFPSQYKLSSKAKSLLHVDFLCQWHLKSYTNVLLNPIKWPEVFNVLTIKYSFLRSIFNKS